MPLKNRQQRQSRQESNNNKNNLERIVIRDAVPVATVCLKLKDALQDNGKLKDVLVRRNNLNTALVGALQDLLLSKSSWRTIELNSSDKRSGILILRLLKVLCHYPIKGSIDKLILIDPTNPIVSWMGTVLANDENEFATIRSLSIRSAFLGATIITQFSEGFRSPLCAVERLDFSHTRFMEDGAVTILGKRMADCQNLRELCFSKCHIQDEQIHDLLQPLCGGGHGTLSVLDLDYNYCQKETIEIVSRLLPTLTRLNLSSPTVWDDRNYFGPLTKALAAKNSALISLDLSSNFFRDNHFEEFLLAMRQNTTLMHVSFRENLITDYGIGMLAETLPDLHVRSINLMQNSYTRVECLGDGLASNVFMTNLCVECPTDKLLYYLALNKGGRVAKQPNHIPSSLWPLVLERTSRCLTAEQKSRGIFASDIVFDLLISGPVLLERW